VFFKFTAAHPFSFELCFHIVVAPPSLAATVVANANGKRALSSPPGTVKKRPYRRTKRPKNYNDKSTVTTTTPTLANCPTNVYDAVLGECEDLLKASVEAQRLGRLKMAGAYNLLLHTRLVGLGKRFDRASVVAPVRRNRGDAGDEDDDDEDDYDEHEEHYDNSEDESQQQTPVARGGGLVMEDSNPSEPAQATTSLANSVGMESAPTAAAKTPAVAGLAPALEKLSEILPSNLEMDTSMMEHLARAAVELHHQRTGRKQSAEGLLASPMTGLIGSPPAAAPAEGKGRKDNAKIAWTPEEQDIVEKAVSEKKVPYAIAKLLKNKTEAQVKAFLKNQAKTSEQNEALADDLGSPGKKRGGRGRKPPTTAMNTVPNANLDAKSLLKGLLKRE
jgi:hypothetical protein